MLFKIQGLMLLLGWPLALIAAESAQKETTSPLHIEAYSCMIRADRAREDRAWKEAILSYRQAAESYRRLEKEQPDWHPDVTQFRISYCENEIAAIVKKTKISEKKWLASNNETEQANYKTLYEQAVDEHKVLTRQLEQVQRDLKRAQREMDDLRERLRVPPAMTNELALENAALKNELQKVKEHNAALRETINLQTRQTKTQK